MQQLTLLPGVKLHCDCRTGVGDTIFSLLTLQKGGDRGFDQAVDRGLWWAWSGSRLLGPGAWAVKYTTVLIPTVLSFLLTDTSHDTGIPLSKIFLGPVQGIESGTEYLVFFLSWVALEL